MSQRTQYLSYKLMESSILSCQERALLQVICNRPNFCLENLDNLARTINKSSRTVQRLIKSLVEKGIIIKKYTNYKRVILTLVSIEDQDKIATGEGLMNQAFKLAKLKKKHPDTTPMSYDAADNTDAAVFHTTPMSGPDTTPMSCSINNRNKLNSIKGSDLNFFGLVETKKQKEQRIEQERQRQLALAMKLLNKV